MNWNEKNTLGKGNPKSHTRAHVPSVSQKQTQMKKKVFQMFLIRRKSTFLSSSPSTVGNTIQPQLLSTVSCVHVVCLKLTKSTGCQQIGQRWQVEEMCRDVLFLLLFGVLI